MIPSPLRQSEVLPLLRGTRFEGRLSILGLVGSTSDLVMAKAREGAVDGLCIAAEGQYQGRGRQGRSWVSPVRGCLAFSFLLRPVPEPTLFLTPILAVALARALRAEGHAVGIKWPNDLVLAGRKVAGALVELATSPDGVRFAVVGIGINLHIDAGAVPDRGAFPAGALRTSSGDPARREPLLAGALQAIDASLRLAEDSEGRARIAADYRDFDVLAGREVLIEGRRGTLMGTILSVDPHLGIDLQTPEGAIHRFLPDEVRIKAISGEPEPGYG